MQEVNGNPLGKMTASVNPGDSEGSTLGTGCAGQRSVCLHASDHTASLLRPDLLKHLKDAAAVEEKPSLACR